MKRYNCQKGFTPIALVFGILVAIVLLGGVYYLNQFNARPVQPKQPEPTSVKPSKKPAPDQNAKWKTYTNTKYNYAIDYPPDWVAREYPDIKTGAAFRPTDHQNEVIAVDAASMMLDERGEIPFDEYVKTAAKNEIQNYLSLASIKKLTTDSGLKGYETTWKVAPLTGGAAYTSQPITYLPLPEKYGRTTIQLRLDDGNYDSDYHTMLKSARYTNQGK